MKKIKGNLVELFVDKAVLAIAAIAAIVVLFLFVIGSPNAIKHAGGKLAPGKIDTFINDRAVKLQEKLKEESPDSNSYEPNLPLYLSYIQSAIKDVNINSSFPFPSSTETESLQNRAYTLPAIGQIASPITATVTMAAYVPIEELSDTLTYEQSRTELADVELVTIESSINAQQLYNSFNTAFNGRNIPEGWRIELFAKPVFAKVELQRATLQKDGSLGPWTEVPKIKCCSLNKAIQVPTQTNEYEIQIALVQFAKSQIRNEVLQPSVYDNALPAEPWLCPSLYNEREKRFEREREEEERLRLEAERAERAHGRASRTTTRRLPSGPSGESDDESPSTTAIRSSRRTTRTPEPTGRQPRRTDDSQERTLTEEEQFYAIKLVDQPDLAAFEKLVFWAHDDTAKPGEQYQYRIRIGVINPIAGRNNWFSKEQKDLAEQTLLFSDFSEPTDVVEIPQRIHFFATNSREIEKDDFIDKSVEVKVARYTLGNWVAKTFTVKNGDIIGAVVNTADTRLKDTGIPAESINLSTGFIMVDTRRVTKWTGTGSLRPKEFYELLYCRTGEPVQTMPIKERYWPEDVVQIYKEIEQAEKTEPIVLKERGAYKARTIYSSPGPADRALPGSSRRGGEEE